MDLKLKELINFEYSFNQRIQNFIICLNFILEFHFQDFNNLSFNLKSKIIQFYLYFNHIYFIQS